MPRNVPITRRLTQTNGPLSAKPESPLPQAAANALFQGAFNGVGGVAGLLGGAALYDSLGARGSFLAKAAITATVALLYVCRHTAATARCCCGAEEGSVVEESAPLLSPVASKR